MLLRTVKLTIISLLFLAVNTFAQVKVAAERFDAYLPLLQNKRVAIVGNHTSLVGNTHLLDTLLSRKVKVVKVFGPEHGFRGTAGAGEAVTSSKDPKTGLPVISLYGNKKKPAKEDLADVDILVFDIQDVGCRFYTYLSTMHYIMESCAENKKPLIVLDRPNPNGYYIDGPVLEKGFESFVGMHPIPVVHGMTLGELAQMINGEGWLANAAKCDLTVIPTEGYTHATRYSVPVAPSPNLPNMQAIYLYPSLCFFEGTDVSVGRGTDKPFQVIGKPGFGKGTYNFTPRSIPGVAPTPPHLGKQCSGFDLTRFCNDFIVHSDELYLLWLQGFYEESNDKDKFFNNFFDKLAGTDKLRKQIIAGTSIADIKKSWQPQLADFKEKRKNYLLYTDF